MLPFSRLTAQLGKVSSCGTAESVENEESLGTYVPKVGDIVEFQYPGKTCIGLIFLYEGKQAISSRFGSAESMTWSTDLAYRTAMKTAKKIERVAVCRCALEAEKRLEAYLSAKSTSPELDPESLKQGDVVSYVCEEGKDRVGLVTTRYSYKHKFVLITADGSHWHSFECNPISHLVKKLGHVADLPGSLSDTTARKKLKEYLAKDAKLEPEFTGSYAERYKQWVKHYDVKEGTKVKVLRTAKGYEAGWQNSWTSYMTKEVGKTLEVGSLQAESKYGVPLGEKSLISYPYFVLEVVK